MSNGVKFFETPCILFITCNRSESTDDVQAHNQVFNTLQNNLSTCFKSMTKVIIAYVLSGDQARHELSIPSQLAQHLIATLLPRRTTGRFEALPGFDPRSSRHGVAALSCHVLPRTPKFSVVALLTNIDRCVLTSRLK